MTTPFVVVSNEWEPVDDSCPECGAQMLAGWSGVKCSECKWWFCA